MKTTIAVAVLALALSLAGTTASATFSTRMLSDSHVGRSKTEVVAQMNYSAAVQAAIKLHGRWRYAPRHATCWSHVPWARTCNRVRVRLYLHRRLYRIAKARYDALYAPKPWDAWYDDGATQCEVSHEGAFTTDTNPTYKGRFQMDENFEKSTPFGSAMEDRYGRANKWPPEAQIQHAYEVWLTRSWSPWPPYFKYDCAAWHGRTYH